MTEPRVVVVGAGILGAAAAYHLARAGRRVLVLEAAVPAAGASANSFAWVNAVHKEPEPYHRLNAAGVAEYATVMKEFGDDSGFRPGGSLEWVARDASDELRERVARLASRGYASRFISREQAGQIDQTLAIPTGAEVALFEPDGWVDAPRLIATFLARARALGVEVRSETAVRALKRDRDRVQTIETSQGDVVADAVLLCAGVGTASLASTLGARIPVNGVPGMLAVTSPVSPALGHVVHAPGVHLRPDESGGVRIGATDLDARAPDLLKPDGDARAGAAARLHAAQPLLDRARQVMPALRNADIVTVRIGVRPMPDDRHTIAGPLPGVANAWVIATHSAITMGPLLGRLIAAEMTGAPPHELLAPFRPSRFH